MNRLMPTIVKDEERNILMLAYSNRGSLRKTLKIGKACYYSRERKKLWMKGETSGNFQKILNIKADCDNDSLLFIVKQKGNACHSGKYSCFSDEKFNFKTLYKIIQKRIKSRDENSYSYKLWKNPGLLKKKILEEARELTEAKNKKQVIWETADLLYFMLVFLVKRGVKLEEIERKLKQRNINKSKNLIKKKRRGKWKL